MAVVLAWIILHSARIFVLAAGVRAMFKTSVQTKDVGHGRNLGMKIVMVAAMESLNRILMRIAKRRATFAR